MCVCAFACHGNHIGRSKDNLEEPVLHVHPVGPANQTQPVKLQPASLPTDH